MRFIPLALALSLAAAAPAAAGEAQPLPMTPSGAHSVDLGHFQGVAYYTEEPQGFRVVATLATGEEGVPLRFVATLADRQKVSFSVPAPAGSPAATLEIERSGDRVLVTRPDTPGY